MSEMQTNLTNELGSNFIEYAAAVNSDRAIPDATSGLKPVARRIIYAAYVGGRASNKPHVKCATIVGDVIGKFHPHGDSSVYGALVRLSQNWVMRYPLLDFHGNVGNIGGDGPAHYRYTEARLAPLSEDGLLRGLKKKNVKFIPTFDDSDVEPSTFPAIFPNLLCNPNTGIGVAIASNWACHNLREVAQAIYDYMEGKIPMLPGPDFPTGGLIINKDDIPTIMATGHGSVKIRGKYKIEKNTNIVFYEIPYGVSTEDLLTEIGELCDKKELEGIVAVRDESNKNGLRIVIECEKTSAVDAVIQNLFAKTDLQSSFSYNQVALVDKVPTELNLKQCIEIYVNHNLECIRKEASFDLMAAQERKEIVDGLVKALEDIDNIIKLIKESESAAAARVQLISKYQFTENQAKAIVDMKLGKLAGLEKIELNKEAEELEATVNQLTAILNSEELQKDELRLRLKALVQKYGDPRRTELVQIDIPKAEKEVVTIIPEDCMVVVSQTGDIKRIPVASYKVQKKAGKGTKTSDTNTLAVLQTSTVEYALLFTNKGKMYRLLVDKIPGGTVTAGGGRIADLVKLESGEIVIAVSSTDKLVNSKYVIIFTRKGYVKKSSVLEYTDTKKTTGLLSIKLSEGDEIANVEFCNDEDIMLLTKKGMCIHFESKPISPIGRVTQGVKGIKLDDDDAVLVGLTLPAAAAYLFTISDIGIGKKTSLSLFPTQGRGGKGILAFHQTNNSGKLCAAAAVSDSDSILISGVPNSICVGVSEIPLATRVAVGNMLIKNSHITSITKSTNLK